MIISLINIGRQILIEVTVDMNVEVTFEVSFAVSFEVLFDGPLKFDLLLIGFLFVVTK